MKKYFAIYIVIIIYSSACKKLDVTPPDKLSTTVFWKTAADADLALTGIYGTLYATNGQISAYAPVWWENFSDNSYTQNNQGGAQQSLISGLSPNIGGFPTSSNESLYLTSYKGISAANNFLANVSKVLSGNQLDKYKGEAYFLRAFHYFMLAQTYGNVPIITDDPLTIDFSKKVKKSPRSEVLKLIEDDLDLAIAALPNEKYTNGHVVKGSAQGLKVRVLMFEKKFPEAATLAHEIIEDNIFSLHNNYAGNFYKPDQRSSPEIMFSVQFQAPAAAHNFAITTVLIRPGYVDIQGTQDMIDEYEANDPRKNMTFFFPGDTPADGWPFPGSVGTPGINNWTPGLYPGKKWLDPKIINPQPGLLDDQDYVWLRFADIKLMYAEAQNEAVGPDASVYKEVNEVRARTGVNMPPLPAGLNKDQMRERIRHERRVEFALEGLRYFDLRRWGIAEQKLNGFVQNPLTPSIKTVYASHYDFWPLPQTEIDRNKPDLEQNDHY